MPRAETTVDDDAKLLYRIQVLQLVQSETADLVQICDDLSTLRLCTYSVFVSVSKQKSTLCVA